MSTHRESSDRIAPTRVIGTPREYTDDLYRVYLEVGECADEVGNLITNFLNMHGPGNAGMDFSSSLRKHSHGYELDIPLQLVPEVVRELAAHNVAIYQIIRISKL